MRNTVTAAVRDAAAVLAAAGVDTPFVDAQLIAAHLLGCGRMDLFLHGDDETPEGFDELVARRASREPLQYITGTAPVGALDLEVGPGVFIPRPETELLAAWGLGALTDLTAPVVVDLCTGSGTLAIAIASARTGAEVIAVEIDPCATRWAERNIAAHAPDIRLVEADATRQDILPDFHGRVDLVLSNPPYVPETGANDIQPEVRHDPHHAVFGGEDGMSVIIPMLRTVHELLKPGGRCGIEHDDSTGNAVRDAFTRHGGFTDICTRTDLTGRERFTTASRLGQS
ncbi:peptide chain release factor N(5)-glutamine methyltransferase [Corynebacterium sp. P5848]|uniref:peptide chain release factor N(5)-glutamine methyltransferase n=1 Tax=Corynebacterium marambiense TaxID=2765364 RepID=UPI002260BD93|nr:peptide chain release factor N(5)-glutamine methyltransferase [Corynebacterium marambiense]MCX7542018.1 peptide chain release factor N(5)-glutamine methyltransferase [Corynebacterium marambiense]